MTFTVAPPVMAIIAFIGVLIIFMLFDDDDDDFIGPA